ncbi:MAG: competence protein [Flavobacteriaceae bacterium]|uniref:ComEC/Rec2 family competence protein n=1 Tax=Bizionia echini TaxID=649333 RepID=UPI000C9784AF|nr:competence protein [Flavobacteriaceae bacterium]
MLGILVSLQLALSLKLSVILSLLLLFTLTITYFIKRNQFKQSIWFGLTCYTMILSLGNLSVNVHNHLNYKHHYTYEYKISEGKFSQFQLQILEVLKPNSFNQRYVAEIKTINGSPVFGNISLNISKDSSLLNFQVDDKIEINGSLQELYKPLNPHQFDYKRYLENHQIYAQIYSQAKFISVLSTKKHSIYGLADFVRQRINKSIQKYNYSTSELAVINALLLGQRQDIDKELYSDYVNAGAIHILAISGLHIGIILFILKWLFKPFVRIKYGRYLTAIIILFILWSYAVIAGLSPSILRAVTMFSVITIGMYLKRPYNIYNTLAISAFILLIFNPMILFEIGFQLSYLAVIGIVAIHPLLFKQLKTPFWFPNKIITLITVSLAAQLGIFPLSLFYFHQFPGLFLLTNVVVIPFLGFILGYGLLIFGMALIGVPKSLLTDIFGDIISLMNHFFKWVAHQEAFIFKDIPMNWFLVIGLYLIILLFTRYFISKSFSRLVCALVVTCMFQIGLFFNQYWYSSRNELVVFHKSRHSMMSKKSGLNLQVLHDLDSLKLNSDYNIPNYRVGSFIKQIDYQAIQNVYRFNQKQFLIIDSLGIYQNISFHPEYIILSQSPKINLNRLIDSLNPKVIIADGSNFKSYVKRWTETCRKRKRLFHYTGEKGAFILKED